DYRPSGAAEIRQAGTAFLAMRQRIERQITQRNALLAGVSADLRAPLASRRVIEFFGALPLEHFIEEGVPRSLARAVLAGQIPDEMLGSRAGGMQFGDWFSQLSARRSAMQAAMPRLR
ncbi:asparagine synthase-related protein, partial [Salmonella enterica]|uniref:asparagine synthase-related protein n=1 Tax=Salmonella enterica TaxID=28901 RepID=UPI003D28D200